MDLGPVGGRAYQTAALAALSDRYPEIQFVIAHLAQPPLRNPNNAGLNQKWEEQIVLGLKPNIAFDLSALPAYARAYDEYPYRAALNYIQRALRLIGAEKIMWGSDVPGLLTSGTYRQLLNYVKRHCEFSSAGDLAGGPGLERPARLLALRYRRRKGGLMAQASSGEQDRASQGVYTQMRNSPERLAWYQDMALGMYLYWTVDASLGLVNAHSVIGASPDYLERYFRQLPAFFNPQQFDAGWYARLAKLCGFDYVTVATKNHNGFCMWDTATTPFNVMNTAYGKDILREYVDALRANGLPVGMYFSPDDAWFQWQRGRTPARARDYANSRTQRGATGI